jgi:hypothetical protein
VRFDAALGAGTASRKAAWREKETHELFTRTIQGGQQQLQPGRLRDSKRPARLSGRDGEQEENGPTRLRERETERSAGREAIAGVARTVANTPSKNDPARPLIASAKHRG